MGKRVPAGHPRVESSGYESYAEYVWLLAGWLPTCHVDEDAQTVVIAWSDSRCDTAAALRSATTQTVRAPC